MGLPENHPAILEAIRKGLIREQPAPAPAKELAVTLPAPPSVNNLFATVRGRRVKTKAYREWLKATEPALARLAPPASYPCRMRLVIGGRVNRQRDWDNFIKPVQDAAKAAGVIEGDSLTRVTGGVVEYRPGDGPAVVTVWFEPVGAA